MKLLEGKVAVVTGAARGIGKAIALKFAQEGANIAFTDLVIDENGLATQAEIEALGVKEMCIRDRFASGVSTFVQCRKLGPVGAGLLCIQGTSFSFIGPIITAGLAGGLPLIFRVCIAASPVEMIVSRTFKYLRSVITPLVSGLSLIHIYRQYQRFQDRRADGGRGRVREGPDDRGHYRRLRLLYAAPPSRTARAVHPRHGHERHPAADHALFRRQAGYRSGGTGLHLEGGHDLLREDRQRAEYDDGSGTLEGEGYKEYPDGVRGGGYHEGSHVASRREGGGRGL